MPPKGSPYRSLLILFIAALLIIPAAVTFFHDSINLTGTAIRQSVEQADEQPAEDSQDQSDSGDSNSEDTEGDEEPAPEPHASDENETAGDAEAPNQEPSPEPDDTNNDETLNEHPAPEPTDTDDETLNEDPAPEPTAADDDESGAVEATEEPSDHAGDNENEATDEPSGDDEPETTEETVIEPTPAPEATEEPAAEITEEPALEVTAEATPELLPEATAEVTVEPVMLDVALACGPEGAAFTVSNTGVDMTAPEAYSIDGETAGELQLAAGESTTISAGFGTPLFSVAGASAQPDEPCLPPPALEVSAVCGIETGATFVIANSGGPMTEAQAYTLNGEPAGEFLLGAGETAQIEAGYGSPVFASGDLSAALEETCNPPGSIGGGVWLDVDGDGTLDEAETVIADMTITLTASDGSTQEGRTNDEGRYAFIHLLPGEYTVQIENPPAHTRASYDAEGEADSSANITVAFEAISADFGYQPLGTISGVIWTDLNGDGSRSEDETGIAGITVTLSGGAALETTSADDGSYRFTDLPYGDYVVRIATPPADTLPLDDAQVTLTSEQASADFGYQPVAKPSISGVVWADVNGDGVRDADEPGLSSITITLTGADTEAQAITSGSGAYSFADLPAGEYSISIVAGENFIVTADASSTLALADEPVENVNFGLQPTRLGTISGAIWLETGDFGVRNAGETGIAGVVIELLTSSGAVIQTVTLEADGAFRFTDLIPGTYAVRISAESLPDQLFVTYNPDGSDEYITPVTLPPGEDASSIDFGLVGAF